MEIAANVELDALAVQKLPRRRIQPPQPQPLLQIHHALHHPAAVETTVNVTIAHAQSKLHFLFNTAVKIFSTVK